MLLDQPQQLFGQLVVLLNVAQLYHKEKKHTENIG